MNTKTLVAAGFALAGVAVAGFALTSSLSGGQKPGSRLRLVTREGGGPPGGGSGAGEGERREAPTIKAGGDAADALASSAKALGDAPEEEAEPRNPPNFAVVKSDEDVAPMLVDLEEQVANATASIPEVQSLGVQAQAKLAAATRTALEPYFLGSRNKVIEAIQALGGTPPDPNAPPPTGPDGQPMPGPRGGPGGPLINLLKHASIDLANARILPVMQNGKDFREDGMRGEIGGAVSTSGKVIPGTTPAPGAEGAGGAGGEQRREISVTAGGGAPPRVEAGASQGPPRDRMVMKMMQRGAFPGVEDPLRKKLTVVEVRAPLLLEGEKPGKDAPDIEIGIDMAWNPEANQWQPAGFTLYPKNQQSMMKVAQAMRAAQQG